MGYATRFNQSKYRGANWFNPQSRSAIPRLFPGFWRCFNAHQQEIYSVVGNYAESSIIAHGRVPKNALTFSQAALEGLGRWVLGRERRQRREESASDYIKEALDKAGVNHGLLDYPNILKLWQDKYKESGDADDGPDFLLLGFVISRPIPSSRKSIFSDYLHAWNLSHNPMSNSCCYGCLITITNTMTAQARHCASYRLALSRLHIRTDVS